MSGFFGKLFGGKSKNQDASEAAIMRRFLEELFEKSGLDLSFKIDEGESEGPAREYRIDLSGEDEKMVTEKDGHLLEAMQLLLQRVMQHQIPNEEVNVTFDCRGFREEANKSLLELAEKLKEIALEKGKSVYCRALPPKDRKVVHQYLAGDGRVKSRSIGDGLYKKIKIFPVKSEGSASDSSETTS